MKKAALVKIVKEPVMKITDWTKIALEQQAIIHAKNRT